MFFASLFSSFFFHLHELTCWIQLVVQIRGRALSSMWSRRRKQVNTLLHGGCFCSQPCAMAPLLSHRPLLCCATPAHTDQRASRHTGLSTTGLIQQDVSLPNFHSCFLTYWSLSKAWKISKGTTGFYFFKFVRAWDAGCWSLPVSAGTGRVTMKKEVVIGVVQFISVFFYVH